jgi:hypothetical protein
MWGRLEQSACRTAMTDRRLNVNPPASVLRVVAETRILAGDPGETRSRRRGAML